MNYYHCSIEELHSELRRRGHKPYGSRDELSETLQKDDEKRGVEATMVTLKVLGPYVPRQLHLLRTAEFGETVSATSLLNEEIIFWTMNTFFPTLQLFFASGRSCNIDGGRVPSAKIGLDPELRFRLTDCNHEEDGRIFKTLRPDKFAHAGSGIVIREAIIGQRTSVTVKPEDGSGKLSSQPDHSRIGQEVHTVVGLRLQGMSKIGYAWAKAVSPSGGADNVWGDVRIAGLRDDIPAPHLGFPLHFVKPGGEVAIVSKESQVSNKTLSNGDKSQILRRFSAVDARG